MIVKDLETKEMALDCPDRSYVITRIRKAERRNTYEKQRMI